MKAIVQNAYGSSAVLSMAEIADPTIGDGKVLVRIHATSVNAGDYFSMRGSPWLARFSVGFPKPKNYILGWDLSGVVEAVGSGVTRFQPGDEVYASVDSTFAELAVAPEDKFAPKPKNLSFEEAAAVPSAGLTALFALRNTGDPAPDADVLVNGASGGVGSFAVQLAKAQGATVTGVCSTKNVELVRSIGADFVVNYTAEDFTTGVRKYNLILDQVGNRSLSDLRRALKPEGRIQPNTGHGGMSYVMKSAFMSLLKRQHGKLFVTKPNGKDLQSLTDLIEAGKVTPVIDRTYPLSKVPDAMAYAEKGHARGKVVITVP